MNLPAPEPSPPGHPDQGGLRQGFAPLSGQSPLSLPPALTWGLLAFLCLLYVPFAGNYGLWDPWETHYAEVARQMVERNDWISLWWPGSPQDAATFWSKPVLTFWLMALSMKLFGLGHPGLAHAAEMTVGWRAEWALRLPFVLLGIAGVWAVYHLVRRLLGPRPALWSAVVLGTCTQWSLITRQAMTDMAFVTPMNLAMCWAGLALLLPPSPELPRQVRVFFGRAWSWPRDPLFTFFVAAFALCTLPQLIVDCVQIGPWQIYLPGRSYRTYGVFAMLPWVAVSVLTFLWALEVRTRRAIYLWLAYLMGGLATLAKGPAGMALPAICVVVFLAVSGRWRDFLGDRRERPWAIGRFLPAPLRPLAHYDGGLELLRGTLVFLCVGAPWYVAMLVRHGSPFWMEMIGDNYVRRAQGRHGDRGTYEYYLRQLAGGLFPWSGVVAAALLRASAWLREAFGSPRRQLALYCMVWALVDFMVVALVQTKFHHYILPALPALAILAGLFLDELCTWAEGRPLPWQSPALLLALGLPLTWLSGRDLAGFPARIGWLFNYDYVNVPVSGRPWPLTSIYGQRYEYAPQVFAFAILAVLATLVLIWAPAIRERERERRPRSLTLTLTLTSALTLAAFLTAAILTGPSPLTMATWSSSTLPPAASLPPAIRLGFLVPATLAGLWLLGLLRRRRALFLVPLCLVAVYWNAWVLDAFLVQISPHWSQKHLFATYYRLRRGPDEPVVAWYLYWRGENFYTKNQIYDPRLPPQDKTVFLGDHHTEHLQAYVNTHRGRRIFFVFERHRLDQLRGLLPPEARPTLQVVDESNNKLYLAVAQL